MPMVHSLVLEFSGMIVLASIIPDGMLQIAMGVNDTRQPSRDLANIPVRLYRRRHFAFPSA
ncbi:hypothetical protein BDV36DRAFT_301524 [Aspergillus pseudocaelatus]|uniref:Uncharacterized protein n=1 Tax=Aspergillus pseudocaelatus TaxID=1825620 RepID=A0ABQ6W561_9EURO|nr:hypothetical protein BDV36DRAFT_301524 [Aspergillus pseudocaelatus]